MDSEMNEYIESGNIDKANEFLKLMKIERMEPTLITNYENELKELIKNQYDKQVFDNRINESISKQKHQLSYAKNLMNEMEESGNQILENLHNNHEKIKNIQHKVKETDEKITYTITKRMMSLFNRF